MARFRYEPNRKGIRDMLSSEWVEQELRQVAGQVAAAAWIQYQLRPPHSGEVEVVIDSSRSRGATRVEIGPGGATISNWARARAAVIAKHPAALHIEEDRRPLGRALDNASLL